MTLEEQHEAALDEELKAVLGSQPRPEASAYFAARVTRLATAQHEKRRTTWILATYWIGGSVLLTLALGSALSPAAQSWFAFLLVPAAFAAGYAWKGRATG